MTKYIAVFTILILSISSSMAQEKQVEQKESTNNTESIMLKKRTPTIQKNKLQTNQKSQTDLMLKNKSLYQNGSGTNQISFDKKGNIQITEYNIPGLKYHPQGNRDYNNSVGVDVSVFQKKKKKK